MKDPAKNHHVEEPVEYRLAGINQTQSSRNQSGLWGVCCDSAAGPDIILIVNP
jgi:hypothetical protein